MTDAHLALSYAGAAAQEEDTLGLPSYAQFKNYATFRTDLADFGVDFRQLNRLLVECEYGIAVGGMGLGDLNILFSTTAKRMGALNYEGVLQLCRMLRPRLAKVEAMMSASSEDQRDPVKYRPASATGTPAPAKWASTRGLLPSTTSLRSRSLHRVESATPVDFAAVLEAGDGASASGSGSSAAHQHSSQTGPRGVSFRQPRGSEHEGVLGSSHAGGPGAAAHARPASASRLTFTHNEAAAAGAAGAGPSTSGRGAVPDGLSSLMALKDPPVLLREHMRPPPCNFPSISARISGIQVLYRDGEMTRVALALRDLQRAWEQAASAAAVSQALRRQALGAASSIADSAEMALRGEIPLEGRIWLLLLHGCSLMLEGKHRTARKSLQAAESLFNPNVLGMEHPYHYCIHMFFGLLSYYEQQYDEAIEKFDCARELADLVSRGSFNVSARRNAAACLNNKGVCHSLLGNRSDAVIAFRAAHQLLRAVDGVPEVPEAVVAQRNLNKALKQGFALNTARLRPTSAPALYAHVGSTKIPADQKLQTFLQTAITMRAPAPVTTVPAWCNKVTADDIIARKKQQELEKKAKAKAAEKGKSDKAKGGPKPKKLAPFEAMSNYPFAAYGVANVKLAVKKGRKKKPAAAT